MLHYLTMILNKYIILSHQLYCSHLNYSMKLTNFEGQKKLGYTKILVYYSYTTPSCSNNFG